jgi:hypothetical protein
VWHTGCTALTRYSDLFNYAVSRFSVEEFAEQGLTPEDISLIQFMAQQVSRLACPSIGR